MVCNLNSFQDDGSNAEAGDSVCAAKFNAPSKSYELPTNFVQGGSYTRSEGLQMEVRAYPIWRSGCPLTLSVRLVLIAPSGIISVKRDSFFNPVSHQELNVTLG